MDFNRLSDKLKQIINLSFTAVPELVINSLTMQLSRQKNALVPSQFLNPIREIDNLKITGRLFFAANRHRLYSVYLKIIVDCKYIGK